MSGLDEFKATFFQECADLLSSMENGLMAIDSGEPAGQHIDAIFRAVHSVKGGAGAFNFSHLVGFAHAFETVLDHLRQGKLQAKAEVVDTMLRAGDILADLVGMAEQGNDPPADYGAEARAQLAAIASGGGATGAPKPVAKEAVVSGEVAPEEFDDIEFTPVTVEELEQSFDSGPKKFEIVFSPNSNLYRSANEPLILFRELRALGECDIEADASRIPALASLDPTGPYITWRISLATTHSRDDVEEIFEFVSGDCDLTFKQISDAAELPGDQPTEPEPQAPTPPPAAAPAPAVKPNAKVEAVMPPAAKKSAAAPQEGPGSKKEGAAASIRVDLDRMDRVVDTVGELVITQAMLTQTVRDLTGENNHGQLWQSLESLAHVVRELQECVMSMRAQPVRSVFQRMPRLVREVSGKVGKRVRLVTSGEATEIDKTVTELLADPLTHMIRNAIDHGIEGPDERVAANKSAEGNIFLSAEHRGGRIIIEVADDGGGIDRKRVREKAIDKNLIGPDDELTDEQIDNLLFLPGFSTATQVSDISGRGVGMDVVRRNVEAIGGRIAIRSTPGQGSTFRLTLPLTLAVMDGMVVSVGAETFILPLASIVECLRPQPRDIQEAGSGSLYLVLRGQIIPLIFLSRFFNIPGAAERIEDGVIVVTEIEGGGRFGLLVDEIRGQQQVVVKSLEANYGKIDGAAAATVLGDGKVALILNVDEFSGAVSNSRPASARRELTKLPKESDWKNNGTIN